MQTQTLDLGAAHHQCAPEPQPMGTAVLSNSSWSLNQERLAALRGFDGVIVNSPDAGHISTYDVPLEATAIGLPSTTRDGWATYGPP